MNLKLRLNLIITSLLILIMVAGVLLSFNNARKNALAEISSAERLTLYLFDTANINLNHTNLKEFDYHAFKLNRLAHMRHLKIELVNNAGIVLDTNQVTIGHQFHNEAPAWVERILNSISPAWQPSIRPIDFQGQTIGKLVITPDPTYEYAEIWKQMTDLFILLSVFFVCVNLIISWAIAQALKPTEKILSALDEIEKGNLEARLPEFQWPELARIGDKFNRMIGTLQKSIFQNHKLTQQFITLQEEERKSLARDLHDEFGQCLTAINTDASVILKHAKNKYPDLYASAFAITDLSRHLMDLVSGLLQKLRPGVLNELGLAVALHDLVDTWQLRNENTLCALTMSGIEAELGDAESLTLYRLVQECLTNISRHANASTVKINVHSEMKVGKPILQVDVYDDGKGFDTSIRANGLGLPGMRERVEGLNGELTIASQLNQGTSVSAWIPLLTKR